ncbi:MAG TPA: 16S rRNA (guanine(966)-N(2))-methyltransferase RsmD [Candidatus Saccharimonadales bacterium]|nr:16S rRNA (guanine(966)-N(2))-methyltransferase RsmD [Candidatus Saccharimonadales bacterium]
MRIIAGTLGGRQFSSPHGHRTHPMSDKARGGLFNALGDIEGLQVLDAFAGTGALGYEALSRGAASVVAIESDRSAQTTIAQNISDLGLSTQIKLVKASANAWLTFSNDVFDIALLDPPYDDLQLTLLTKLAERAKPGGVIVLSLPPTAEFALPESSYELLKQKSYGDIQLVFYRRHRI